MELTLEELDAAIERAKVYPAGIPTTSWGAGIMDRLDSIELLNSLSREKLRECG